MEHADLTLNVDYRWVVDPEHPDVARTEGMAYDVMTVSTYTLPSGGTRANILLTTYTSGSELDQPDVSEFEVQTVFMNSTVAEEYAIALDMREYAYRTCNEVLAFNDYLLYEDETKIGDQE